MKIKYPICGLVMASTLAYGQVPQPSELDQTKLELYRTQLQVVQSEGNRISGQIQQLIQKLNEEHPGFQFNYQNNSFVPVPKVPSTETKPEPAPVTKTTPAPKK